MAAKESHREERNLSQITSWKALLENLSMLPYIAAHEIDFGYFHTSVYTAVAAQLLR
jgi:hypothetical protein